MKRIIIVVMCLFSFCCAFAQNAKQSVQISGTADFLENGDTVKLIIYKHGLINQEAAFHTILFSTVQNRSFKFSLKGLLFPEYITIQFPKQPNLGFHNYLVEPGAKINLNLKVNRVEISGKLCAVFRIQYLLRSIESNYHHKQRIPEFNATNLRRIFTIWDSIASDQTDTLMRHKKELSEKTFTFLVNEINATFNWTEYYDLNYYGAQYQDSLVNPIANSYLIYKRQHIDRKVIENNLTSLCNNNIEYIIEKYKVDSCLLKKRRYDVSTCLQYFRNNYKRLLREQLIISVLSATKDFPKSLAAEINASLIFTFNPDYRLFLKMILQQRVDGGSPIEFSLTDTLGKKVNLSDFRDRIAVLDFWYTGCGNCRELAPIMQEVEQQFKNKPILFVGVCIDKNRNQFKKSVAEGKYVSPKILNVYSNGNGEQDKAIQELHVKAYPTLIIINRNGKIVNVSSDPRDDNGKSLATLLENSLLER